MEMVDNTLIGIVLGTFIRLLPEIIKFINKLVDNKHELTMLKESFKISDNAVVSKVAMAESPIDHATIDNWIRVQTQTGSKKLDFINGLVRPHVTYILLWLYVSIKVFWFYFNPTASLNTLWTPDDMTLLGGILSFWFLGRVFDKK